MAHQIMNFEGLKFYERNSFLHFIEDLEEPSRASRSRSVPAMARRSLESPALAPSPCAVATTSTTLSQIDDGLEWMEKGEFLTLMIRGIPCSCKRDEILEAIEELGFSGRYDFFFHTYEKGPNSWLWVYWVPRASIGKGLCDQYDRIPIQQQVELKGCQCYPCYYSGS